MPNCQLPTIRSHNFFGRWFFIMCETPDSCLEPAIGNILGFSNMNKGGPTISAPSLLMKRFEMCRLSFHIWNTCWTKKSLLPSYSSIDIKQSNTWWTLISLDEFQLQVTMNKEIYCGWIPTTRCACFSLVMWPPKDTRFSKLNLK